MSGLIPYKFGGFSSAQVDADGKAFNRVFDQGLAEGLRDAGSASRRCYSVEGVFGYKARVERITCAELGSDMTTQGLWWGIYLRHADGGYTVAPVIEGRKNIVRGGTAAGAYGFSKDAKLKEGWAEQKDIQNEPLDFTLPEPVEAVAVYMVIRGHGWYRVVALDCYGEKTGEIPAEQFAKLEEDMGEDMRHIWKAA